VEQKSSTNDRRVLLPVNWEELSIGDLYAKIQEVNSDKDLSEIIHPKLRAELIAEKMAKRAKVKMFNSKSLTKKSLCYDMSTSASQSSAAAAKNKEGPNAASKKKATPKFKTSYASMIIEAIQEMKQKKGSSRQAIIKQISGTSNKVPNALLITKTIKKMIEDGKLVPAAQAGHIGAGSFKISPQEKLRIMKVEKAAAKKEMKKVVGTKPSGGGKKVAKKSVGAQKVVKKSAKKVGKKSAKSGGTIEKRMKLMKLTAKKTNGKSKKIVAAPKKGKK